MSDDSELIGGKSVTRDDCDVLADFTWPLGLADGGSEDVFEVEFGMWLEEKIHILRFTMTGINKRDSHECKPFTMNGLTATLQFPFVSICWS